MKNKVLNKIIVILALVVTLLNLFGYIANTLYYDIEDLPEGKFISSTVSKDKTKVLKIYKVDIINYGSAIRGELVSTTSGKEIIKNVYWQVGKEDANVVWIDDINVQIDDQIVNVQGSGFDCRKQIDIPDVPATAKGLS